MKRESPPGSNPAKEEMRRAMRASLRTLTPAARAAASLAICQEAAHLPAFLNAKCIALFAPMPTEPDVHLLAEEAWAEKKRLLLPLMIKNAAGPQLDWHEVKSWDELIQLPGSAGLREPDPLRCPRARAAEIDCAFVPGLAFDSTGHRLGRGGGFYDYFLSQAPEKLPRIGLMFNLQKVASVPREPHDHRLHAVVTDNGLLKF